ncbi:Dnaja3 [Symbiodinium necroappetens]|uniref:Dnaja3 protein n=1 Tax=Symbiodinium necroappetens TaxID=1628268 RepID=A0A812T4I2_9DINO|nr:Dnaja3 [Symbiodinium necroappetens]
MSHLQGLSLRRCFSVLLRRHRSQGPSSFWSRGNAWQAPKVNCYLLLGVPETASLDDIRKAYLQRAKSAHPDVVGSCSNDMVQLNLCYEALTQKRREYDAAKGIGFATGRKASASASSGSSATNARDAWWRAQGGFDDQDDEEFYPFHFQDFAEKKWRVRRENGRRRPTWEEFAQMWDEGEFDARARGSRRMRGRRASRRVQDSSSDEEEFETRHLADRRRVQQSCGCVTVEVPQRGRNMRSPKCSVPGRRSSDIIGGGYLKLDTSFNGRPAFKKKGDHGLYMFWSQQFGDWKIAERLQDDGACLGFAEDMRGRRRPWLQHPPLRWRLWEPTARRFVPKRLNVVDGPEVAGAAWQESQEDSDDDEVPWSRPHWSKWSTADLIRWCDRRNIDLSGCFDREAVVDRVATVAKQDMARDGDDFERTTDRVNQVRVASRVKTDGSYTKPPTLDRRSSLYGRAARYLTVHIRKLLNLATSCTCRHRSFYRSLRSHQSWSRV